jgi:hypothetical protein
MYEVKRAFPKIEDGIYGSVLNFFVYGLSPGSYTTFMFMHNFERAKRSAHPHLLNAPHGKMSAHEALEYAFNDLPEFIVGENFRHWPGYVNLPELERQLVLDSYSDERIEEWDTYNIISNCQYPSFRVWIDLAEGKLRIKEKCLILKQ